MNRVTFLIDGFNVYHSILSLKRHTGYLAKWLNLSSLCKSYLNLFSKDARLKDIYYFSALAHYLSAKDPNKITKHKNYIACLESLGLNVELGRFKEKDVFCDRCKSMILKHEEKETDVAIGVKLLEILFTDSCDSVIIVSGDTDLSPAIRKGTELFPNKRIIFAFPFARKNKELLSLAPESFSISKRQYIRHQLPNPVILKDGKEIYKPSSW
ncbi:MAG: NYN domain-containing protein [Candidatus Omnitrophica bacterium]|nr:NYN domain-containing protein [Candidatus Omnitrophota bacterium]MBU0878641.1 NYN domain-containing protein [Candidatus Omnitrophota bacterium]MBU1524020.1 NYN domain-containing protein [Candidatus Omnitrophota bacterium]MBU1810115.1 NYN domain-containing protein [Candidatus Omnitrophota bacterium]MBU2437151.1 NYN domain-containing protein [Candidatus Omnitrophota bacterium]